MDDLRFRVVDRTNTLVAELPDAKLESVRWELNQPGYINYIMNQNDPKVSVPVENLNEIQLLYRGKVIKQGIHLLGNTTPATAEFQCPGLLQYFNFRFVTNSSLYFGFAADGVTPLGTGIDQLVIGAQIVAFFQRLPNMSWNITVAPFSPSTVLRYRNYALLDHQNVLQDILAEFPGLKTADGTQTGFDFDVITNGPSRQFTMFYPRQGSVRNDVILEYGNNVSDYAVTKDGSKKANRAWMTGGSNGDIKFEQHYEDTVDETTYGMWEYVDSQSDENDVNTLLELATTYVADHKVVIPDVSVTASDTSAIQLFDNVHVGDTVIVKIINGRDNINTLMRIIAIEWQPGPGNLTLEMVYDG